jgi:hypothetical protein
MCNGRARAARGATAWEYRGVIVSQVLDREICSPRGGQVATQKLLFRQEWPDFYAFDVLSGEREDPSGLPLLERKR